MSFSESIKLKVRQKAHFLCCVCKSFGVEIHHIVPEENGGPDTEDNAAPLCPSCHEIYGANPTKRKLIREVRDQWYVICSKRFSFDGGFFQEFTEELRQKASKEDINELKKEIVDSIQTEQKLHLSTSRGHKDHLGIDELVTYLMNTDSVGRENQCKLLLLRGFWPVKDGLKKIRKEFLENFGMYTAIKAAAITLADQKIPIHDGLTEQQIIMALGLLKAYLACYNLAHDGEIQAALTADGQLLWQLTKSPQDTAEDIQPKP